MKLTLTSVSLLTLLPYVAAHGYVRQIAIDGKIYRGNIPRRTNFDSPIRAIDDSAPVKGANNRAMNCGPIAPPAKVVAPANAGSRITFDWAGGDDGLWPHNTGPMLTYLASCGNTTCDKFDAINARWFKIDEAGRKNDGTNVWFQQDIMEGKTYTTTLPANLAPGDYLIRHEIIGLHIAQEVGGAEFYPSCTQVRVTSNGNGVPKAENLVEFPGAYSDRDPGIVVNAFDANLKYQFPGPQIDPELAAEGVAITAPAPPTDGLPDPAPVPTSAPVNQPAPTITSVTTSSIPSQPSVPTQSGSSFTVSAQPTPVLSTPIIGTGSASATVSPTSTPAVTSSFAANPFPTVTGIIDSSAPAVAPTGSLSAPVPPASSSVISPPAPSAVGGSGTGSGAEAKDGLYTYKPRRLSRIMLRHLDQI